MVAFMEQIQEWGETELSHEENGGTSPVEELETEASEAEGTTEMGDRPVEELETEAPEAEDTAETGDRPVEELETEALEAEGTAETGDQPVEELEAEAQEPEGTAEMGELPVEDWDYQRPRRGQVRTGVILSIGEQEIIVDVGDKRDGIVPYADMQRLGAEAVAELEPGQEVMVFIMRPEDQDGNLLVSLHLAKQEMAWQRAAELFESGEVWEGTVIGYNKGGLVIPVDEIRGFVPASQVPGFPQGLNQEERLTRLSQMVDETLTVKVIEINRRKRRLILSATRAQREWRRQQRERLLTELREGEVRRGTVSSLCPFGAFVDLGGADGLIHLSELSWRRIRHPREVVNVDDEVEVYVLRLDHDRKRIGLSLKRLQPEPWSLVEDKYELGQLVEGVVTNVVDFGAFAEIEEGVEGLIHVSELADAQINHPKDVVKRGDLLLLRIIRIDARRKRLGLSLKRVLESEWAEWAAQLAEAERATEAEKAELAAEEEAKVAELEEAVEAEVAPEEELPVAEEIEPVGEAAVEEPVEAGVAPEEELPVAEEMEPADEAAVEEPVEAEVAPEEELPVAEEIEPVGEAAVEEPVEAEVVPEEELPVAEEMEPADEAAVEEPVEAEVAPEEELPVTEEIEPVGEAAVEEPVEAEVAPEEELPVTEEIEPVGEAAVEEPVEAEVAPEEELPVAAETAAEEQEPVLVGQVQDLAGVQESVEVETPAAEEEVSSSIPEMELDEGEESSEIPDGEPETPEEAETSSVEEAELAMVEA
jgi:small subunit ribosomal protein S1